MKIIFLQFLQISTFCDFQNSNFSIFVHFINLKTKIQIQKHTQLLFNMPGKRGRPKK